MAIPSVPTIGKAETASVPWVTVAVADVVGPVVVAGPVIVTGVPLTIPVIDPGPRVTVRLTVYVPFSA